MTITGTFAADFSAFRDAVDGAEVKLRSFEDGSNKVAGALSRMTDSFSGRKVVQEAELMAAVFERAGGAASFTQKELARMSAVGTEATEKLNAMGVTVPAGLQRMTDATQHQATAMQDAGEHTQTFTGLVERLTERALIYEGIRKAFDFTKELLESTARLEELSLATGISTTNIQRLSYVAQGFGVDADTMARGVEQLSARLANGDQNAVAAVQLLGLSVKDLMAAGPEEAFLQIASAVGHIEDPMVKGGIAAEVFGGRLAKILLPLLSDLRREMNAVPKDAMISDENVKAAHEFDVALSHLWTTTKALTVEGLSGLISALAKADGDGFVPATQGAHLLSVAMANQEHTTIKVTQTVKEKLEADRLAAEALKKFAEAEAEVNSAGVSWQGTLETISGDTVDAIRYYLDAGVAQDKLATFYGLTATQIRSVASALKDEAGGLKAEEHALEQTTKLWDEYLALKVGHGGTATDKLIADNDRWYADTVATAQKAGTDTAEFYDALEALSHEKRVSLSADWGAIGAHSKENLQQIADKAQATFDYLSQHASSFSREFIQQKKDEAQQAQWSANGWGDAFGKAVDTVKAKADEANAALKKVADAAAKAANMAMGNSITYDLSTPEGMAFFRKMNPSASITAPPGYFDTHTVQQAVLAGLIDFYAGYRTGSNLARPGFAEGVTNFGGGWATVGERGPETMYVPKGATIWPHGAGGGGVTIQNLNVTQPFGTPAQIAAAIDDALIQRQLSIGTRF